MKTNVALIILAISILFPQTQAEARKGLGSLFKLGRGAKALNGIKNYDSDTLTIEQLRSCLSLEKNTNASEVDLSYKKAFIENREKKIKQFEREISTIRVFLDANLDAEFDSQQQVDKFNLEIEKYNQIIAEYNLELDYYKNSLSKYNIAVGLHNELVNNFQVSCAGKRYYEDDLISANIGFHE